MSRVPLFVLALLLALRHATPLAADGDAPSLTPAERVAFDGAWTEVPVDPAWVQAARDALWRPRVGGTQGGTPERAPPPELTGFAKEAPPYAVALLEDQRRRLARGADGLLADGPFARLPLRDPEGVIAYALALQRDVLVPDAWLTADPSSQGAANAHRAALADAASRRTSLLRLGLLALAALVALTVLVGLRLSARSGHRLTP